MSEELITKIEQMLHEEKWTRTAIGAYTVSLIKELDVLLVQASVRLFDRERLVSRWT